VGIAQKRDITRLFGWSAELTDRALVPLVRNAVLSEAEHPKEDGKWLALARLCR
jgi:hypothetical protein